MKPRIRAVALLISASALAAAPAFVPVRPPSAHIRASSCPWLNESLPIKQRVQELVSAMTLPQMFTEMHAIRATSGPYAGYEQGQVVMGCELVSSGLGRSTRQR